MAFVPGEQIAITITISIFFKEVVLFELMQV